MAQRKVITFAGTAVARTITTLVSGRISTPFTLKRIVSTFSLGCLNLLLEQFYVSPDPEATTSGHPTGMNVLSEFGQVDYIYGEGTQKQINHEVVQEESGAYLKVRCVNNDFYDHAIDVQMEIEVP
jgi:hypothetical protein